MASMLVFSEYLIEMLAGRSFRISPESYFSVNTPAAEKVSATISKLLHLSLNNTLVMPLF
jgi:hypothetical protein